ncbi:MAG TPA: GAF domain-containing sensor histidine kinase [Candidatus Omnitrophota bacterium]|nr:GAF domain-containing sensor histidine kinase [Candidatus Omnitrophota bacterium]HPT39237.1 GAF domain-containing sensor histidine kinase [Candidatus Omnitrophota bacterium]
MTPFAFVGICLLLAIAGIALLNKTQRLKELGDKVTALNFSLEEMDEQAKLIMRTDMELNKAQEELDKKISGLDTLQKLSREISTTLEEKQIFKKINNQYVEELGFEKSLAFLWKSLEREFQLYLSLGYTQDESQKIKTAVNANKDYFLDLIKNGSTVSSEFAPEGTLSKSSFNHLFTVRSFIICPVLAQEGNQGFIFVGTQNTEASITKGDQEFISILANQIGQTLDNARLFEKTWRSQQELEIKVEERTHQLTQALQEVKKISKRKSDFISSVSHEIRTPLTSIKGYAAILLAGKLGELPEEIRSRLEKINRHSDELVHMVNDLLDISRIESGKVEIKKEALSLRAISDKIADLFSEQLKTKNISFNADLPEDCQEISADRSQIERVFINLVGNALKFTPQNGKIEIHAKRINQNIQIDVKDSGFGIPEDAQESIFEEFFRVDNTINQGVKGTGLGLSLVKQIIQAHQGKIWVKSKLGEGSTFSFTLNAA